MKSLRFLLAVVSISGLLAATGSAAVTWQTDYKAALAAAAKDNKMVLIDFTGSTWCPPCKLLARDTFSKPAFEAYAAKKLILLELDFPQGDWDNEALARQNMALLQKYKTDGIFPTLILLNSKGQELGRTQGYLPGGPAGFIKWVESVQKQ